jgi:hypothetical protein
MSRKILDIHIVDLLEQIQEVDKLIQLYVQKPNDVIAMSMVKQYTLRREEFVQKLNDVFTQFSLNLIRLEPIGSKKYASEEVHSFANEPVSDYGTKDKLTEIEGI